MNTQLSRVQVYLNPADVSLLDELAEQIQITRSQIIRDATHAVATRYLDIARLLTAPSARQNPLIELVGFEKSKTGRVGLNVDEIYLHD